MAFTQITSIQEVYERISYEFNSLNIRILNTIVNRHSFTNQEIMTIEFCCNKKEYHALAPYISYVNERRVPTLQPISIYYHDASLAPQHHDAFETVYYCKMDIGLSGGDIVPFIDHFREITRDLRYELESKAFDEEVEKMLTEDRYNN